MIRCYSYVYTTSPSVNNMEISVDLTLFPKKLGQLICYCKKMSIFADKSRNETL